MSDSRVSIEPTYDHRVTGDRYSVETRVNGRPLPATPIPDPFVFHRVTVGWRDLLSGLLRRRLEVVVVVSGDKSVVEDVLELNADYLGEQESSRRLAFREQLDGALRGLAGDE